MSEIRTWKDFDRRFAPHRGESLRALLERVAKYEAGGMSRGDAHRRAHMKRPPKPVRTWSASVFSQVMSRDPMAFDMGWDDLSELLAYFYRMPTGDKLRSRCWSPAKFSGSRAASNVETVSSLVFDFDDGTTIETVQDSFRGLAHIGHTSWSHTEDHHKFRVVLPLSKPIPGKMWRQVYRWALKTWEKLKDSGVGSPDRQCSDPSRLYLVPVYRPERPRYSWRYVPDNWDQQKGGLLEIPPEALAAPAPPPSRRPRPPRQVGSGELERETRKRCREDRSTRNTIAIVLGATIRGDIARGIKCPRCDRASVWYGLDGVQSTSAKCNHRESCGWWGSVYDLAIENGVRL